MAGLLAVAVSLWSVGARAATVTVNTPNTNTKGDGLCGLAEAVKAVNQRAKSDACAYFADGQPDKIVLSAATHSLGAGLTLTRGVEIAGATQSSSIVEIPIGTAITFTGDATGAAPTLRLKDLTVRRTASPLNPATGVWVNSAVVASLVLERVRVTGFTSEGIYLSGSSVHGDVLGSLIENNIGTGVRASEASLTVSSSTLRNNGSGGISATQTGTDVRQILISGSTIENNQAVDGGGIYVRRAAYDPQNSWALDVTNSTLRGNRAHANGGAINTNTNTHITDSVIDGNVAAKGGGGVFATYNPSSTAFVKVFTSTFKNNSAVDGAALNTTSNGSTQALYLDVFQSTLGPKNVASGDGGAIYSTGQLDTVENTTIHDNQAGRGGGIFHDSQAESHATHCTITDNRATRANGGGGLWVGATSNPVYAYNLFAGNVSGASATANNASSSQLSIGASSNLLDSAAGTGNLFSGNGNIVRSDVQLGPFANGVRLLSFGSPAIDAVPQSAFDIADSDQRGLSRPVDGDFDVATSALHDIGAIEMSFSSSSYEAEVMAVHEKSGAPLVADSFAGYSGGAGRVLQAMTTGQFVTFKTGAVVAPGTYAVLVRTKLASNGGDFTLNAGADPAALAAMGFGTTRGATPAVVSARVGTLSVSSSAVQYFKFTTAVGPAPAAYWLHLDSIRLVRTN